ncbi:hypothetical protein H4219_002783 [Mycoemilia scoparia]|uniref:NADH dehydrogenase [ubiquinone] 1 alpha subcomplex subunit 7 n=1 Tax=Mycoemilia scoparia TaxID=417184 RepID=A0A9W7ZWK1_9FUNG|nr:hypothetical protein H4219_002783 [Mycoemilia scoparia]
MLKQFWKAVGDRVWVSPHYLESTLRADTFRKPSTGSQTPYKKPKTENSAIYNNQYFNRDNRRNYPRVAVYDQQDVGKHLLLSYLPEAQQAVSAPVAKTETTGEAKAELANSEEASVPSVNARDVVDALTQINKPIYTASSLPPMPGKAHRFEISQFQTEASPGQYYPMYRVC